jgi:hypothetical protein
MGTIAHRLRNLPRPRRSRHGAEAFEWSNNAGDGVAADEIVAALRVMYARVPVPVEAAPTANEFTPG